MGVTSVPTPSSCIALDRASFNQGKNALYDFSIDYEKCQTLVAKGPGGVLDLRYESGKSEL